MLGPKVQPGLAYPQIRRQRPSYSANSNLSKHLPPATEAQKGTLLVCSPAEGSGDRAYPHFWGAAHEMEQRE